MAPPYRRIGSRFWPRYRVLNTTGDNETDEWSVGPDGINIPFMPHSVISAAYTHDIDFSAVVEGKLTYRIANARMLDNMEAAGAWPVTIASVGFFIGAYGMFKFSKRVFWNLMSFALVALMAVAVLKRKKDTNDEA